MNRQKKIEFLEKELDEVEEEWLRVSAETRRKKEEVEESEKLLRRVSARMKEIRADLIEQKNKDEDDG